MTHPATELDDLVHQRVRLGVLAVLAEVKRADFVYLRDTLELTDGNLSRHLQVLENAQHVRIDKRFEGKHPRTWVSVTTKGRAALESELVALRSLIDRVGGKTE